MVLLPGSSLPLLLHTPPDVLKVERAVRVREGPTARLIAVVGGGQWWVLGAAGGEAWWTMGGGMRTAVSVTVERRTESKCCSELRRRPDLVPGW